MLHNYYTTRFSYEICDFGWTKWFPAGSQIGTKVALVPGKTQLFSLIGTQGCPSSVQWRSKCPKGVQKIPDISPKVKRKFT